MGGHQANDALPICSNLKQFPTYIVFLLLSLTVQLAKADIGETYTLKQTRTEILSDIAQLQKDSISTPDDAIVDSLKLCIIYLDEQIFQSYEESISRMTIQRLEGSENDKRTIYLALATTSAALFFAFLLLMARSRVQNNSNSGLTEMYRELTMDFISSVSPEKATAQRLLRVNMVVLIGLMMMSISILAYLLRSL